MQVTKNINMRIGISGTLVFHGANGEVLGTTHISGSAPIAEPDESPTTDAQASQPSLEQSHGPDHC